MLARFFLVAGCRVLGLIASIARGDIAAVPGEVFVEIPGLREFTGRVLACPRKDDKDLRPIAEARIRAFDHEHAPGVDIWSIAVPRGRTEQDLADELMATGLFAWVRPDWRVYVQGPGGRGVTPSDPDFLLQWHHSAIGTPCAWSSTVGLPEVVIAFIDTGVDLDHADLVPNLVPGYCSYLTVRRAQTDGGVVGDDHGHGTAVIGAACAMGNNALAICGVGWRLRAMPIRATNPLLPLGSATSMDIINGAMWAAGHGARVVSVSFAGISEPYVQELGAALRQQGVLLVWPMDNFAINYGSTFDHPDVLVVTGTAPGDARYQFSSFGDAADLCAPAQDIYTTTLGGFAWYQNGTSYAAPLIAGAAGLVLSVATELTPAQVEQVLRETAADLGSPGEDPLYGAGRVDAAAAVYLAPLRQFALGAAPDQPVRACYSTEDLYAYGASPRDIDGDGQITPADARAIEGLLRYDETTETTWRGR